MPGPLIELAGLSKSYTIGTRSLEVLRSLDLVVEHGEFVAIMGSSGSGKSTLLNILGLLDDYDTGAYELDGVVVRDLSERQAARWRNRTIGFVFQSFHLLPLKTAVENVALPLYYQGVSRRQRNKRALAWLDRMGLADWAGHLPSEMSGGQKQRVAIARAMITDPRLVLADEPTGALDSTTSYEILQILREFNAAGTTILVVTHEDDIAEMTRRVVRLRDGIIEQDRVVGP
jgi:putative ABC transport system ATP-binding protein